MPIYDYSCEECQHIEELIVKSTDRQTKECPLCGQQTFKRTVSAPGAFILKGPGFYKPSRGYENE